MDADAEHYRDALSPSMQGMLDNGGYVLLNDRNQPVDMDAHLPKGEKATQKPGEQPRLRIQRVPPVILPKIWVGHYQYLVKRPDQEPIKRPLFCFLAKNERAAEELETPVRCFAKGGFTVARFTDETRLREALDDPEYVDLFDMVGLVADPSAIQLLWGIRKELIRKGRLVEKEAPFACACHCGAAGEEAEEVQEPTLENGMVPATVDLSLDAEPFCEQMIYTLYYDDQWYLPLTATNGELEYPGQRIPAVSENLAEAVRLENRAFYADLGTHYTKFLRDFFREFKDTAGWPEPVLLRRLISEDEYLGESNLVDYLDDRKLRFFKKILDLGRCAIARPRLSLIPLV